ncbi:MAG: hypothetical protein QM715_20175 [Nibricoccus sp.]
MKTITPLFLMVAAAINTYAQSDGSNYTGTGPVASSTFSVNDLDASRPHMTGNSVLRTNYHTGLSFSAHSYYGGIRFYNQGYLPTVSNPYDSTAGAMMVMAIMDGNVGVGTTSPIHKLEVAGNALVQGVDGFNATDKTATLYIGDGASSIRAIYDRGLTFSQNGTERMRIQGVTGNVGIGTTSPAVKLDVWTSDAAGVQTALSLNNNFYYGAGSGTAAVQLDFQRYHSTKGAIRVGNESETTSDYNYMTFSTWGTALEERVRINSSGNVGIGTTSPTEKLSVNGRIRAREVIVETTGWSDHVFADSYKLQSLSEVEQHIKTEKHLPGVPSAQEVAEKGVSVGDMQVILLAKVEELTLHMIELKKENMELRHQMESLKASVQKGTP